MARGSSGRIGQKATPKDKYALGTPAEISQRDKTGFQPKGKPFTQIGTAGRGGNLAEPPHATKSGNIKFSKFGG